MTSDLRDLYQELVLDHGRRPRNLRRLDEPRQASVGFNPLCGDKLELFVRSDGDTITDTSFVGTGCAISMASASLLTEAVRGKSRAEASALLQDFVRLLTAPDAGEPDVERFGKLCALAGVREFPVRIKCATLAWRTLEAILGGERSEITTE